MDRNRRVISTHSPEDTEKAGFLFAKSLSANDVVAFFGDLGSGKTTFIKGVVKAFLAEDTLITSPTFAYLNIYGNDNKVYHFDLYRLKDAEEFLSMGFDEFFSLGGVTLIEWAEKIEAIIDQTAIKVVISHAGINEDANTRTIEITCPDRCSQIAHS